MTKLQKAKRGGWVGVKNPLQCYKCGNTGVFVDSTCYKRCYEMCYAPVRQRSGLSGALTRKSFVQVRGCEEGNTERDGVGLAGYQDHGWRWGKRLAVISG